MLVSIAKFYIVPESPPQSGQNQEVSLNIDRYQALFMNQLQNNLQDILSNLNESNTQPDQTEPPIHSAARKYHNLKSNAAMMQMPVLSEIAAMCELVLIQAVESGLSQTSRRIIEDVTRSILTEIIESKDHGSLFADNLWMVLRQSLRTLLELEP